LRHGVYCSLLSFVKTDISQTCIKRSPLGQRKSGLIRQVTSKKRFNSYEIFYDRTRKRWPINTGDCLIEMASRAGFTVQIFLSWYLVLRILLRLPNYLIPRKTNTDTGWLVLVDRVTNVNDSQGRVIYRLKSSYRVMVLSATFNNISAILWRAVLLVAETGENHRPAASHSQTNFNILM
jgi:hypothetical protein